MVVHTFNPSIWEGRQTELQAFADLIIFRILNSYTHKYFLKQGVVEYNCNPSG